MVMMVVVVVVVVVVVIAAASMQVAAGVRVSVVIHTGGFSTRRIFTCADRQRIAS